MDLLGRYLPAAGGFALLAGVAFLESGEGEADGRWRRTWASALILAAVGLGAYFNTFSAPFVFDDIPAIAQNPTIHDLRRPGELLVPPALRGSGAAGRPVVNLSLALNHALGGDSVWGYHAFNLLVHIGAGLALWAVVRRTLLLPRMRARWERHAEAIAFASALLWLVHPLQTESVTCIIQRTESLAGLFYLLTFYGFVRSAECQLIVDNNVPPRGWWGFAFGACVAGVATKETVATAPLLVLLYDRTFVAGTFREAWKERWRRHAALAATWVLAGALVWRSETRGGTVGFGHGVAWWEYALTQCRAVAMYLKLVVWPHPLVLDYGTEIVRDFARVWPQAVLLAVLIAGTLWALWRRPALGFMGAVFFVVLAPSSSVVPLVTQTMAEHRMYLPLAAVVVLAVAGWRVVAGRWFAPACMAAGAALLALTVERNRDYRSVESIWRDNIAKWPGNPRAHYALAQIADEAGQASEAIAQGEAAVRLLPADAAAQFNLAFSLAKAGRWEEAVTHYRQAARLRPEAADAHINLGAVLVRMGRIDEAITEYESVVRLKPDSGEDQFNLAQVYAAAGRTAEAVLRYEAAIRLKPDSAEAHHRLGNARVQLQRMEEAVSAYRDATRLAPDHFEAHVNLAGALLTLGRPTEAIPVYEQALRLQPGNPIATANLALARRQAGR